jgi:hypothetical protein
VPVSCFLLFLCFRKVTQEIFSELDEIKARHPEIYRRFQRTEEEPCPLCVRPPRSTSDDAPSPIKTPDGKNLNTRSRFQKHIAIRRHRRPEIGRVQKLFPAPCRGGESSSEVFFITMLAFGAMSE